MTDFDDNSAMGDAERQRTNNLLSQNFEAMNRLTDALSEVSMGFTREAEQRGRSVLLLRRAVWVMAGALVLILVALGVLGVALARSEQDNRTRVADARAAVASKAHDDCLKANDTRAKIDEGFDLLLNAATPQNPTPDQSARIATLRNQLATSLAPRKC
jgi:type VI protein secretion system component VasK